MERQSIGSSVFMELDSLRILIGVDCGEAVSCTRCLNCSRRLLGTGKKEQ